MNYLLAIEYDGLNYNGWQAQNHSTHLKNVKTIEEELVRAIKIITGYKVKLFASGRTDAGVHALNQVANFKIPFHYDTARFKSSLNGILPADISVKSVEVVHDSFHSTYDAVSKTYLYKINNGYKSPLLLKHSWYIKDKLNPALMREASVLFVGTNNFANFTRKEKEKLNSNYERTITGVSIFPMRYGFDVYFQGKGFLRHMVRRMVGSIVHCGLGRINPESIKSLLDEGVTASSPINAPPYGLFLYSVAYSHKIYC